MLNDTSAITKYIYSSLMSIVYLIASDCGTAVGCDPHPSIVVAMNLVFNELTRSLFVNVNPTRSPVVNLTSYNSWISSSFHLETSQVIMVNVVGFKVTLESNKR